MFNDHPLFSYSAIIADPPWQFKNYSAKGEGKSAAAHYSCMDLPAIKEMPVGDLAAPDCLLMLWATAPMLPHAFEVMKCWGFQYKTMGTWAKQSKTGKAWHFGTGYCLRSASEPFLIGTIGRPQYQSRSVRNLIVAPVREHSRKPDTQYDMMESLIPTGRRIELFARQSRKGWDCWGNQTDKFNACPI